MSFEQPKTEIMKICRELLKQGTVEMVLGFTSAEAEEEENTAKAAGPAIPFFMRTEEEVARSRWDDACTPNLAKYLLEKKDKTAIVAKPCDARAIVVYLAEKQVNRDHVYIIGVECAGMKGKDGIAAPGCSECTVRIPPICDILVKHEETMVSPGDATAADAVENRAADGLEAGREENPANTAAERFDRFRKEMEKCILCFSCRQACCGCYCGTCFIDRGMTDWSPSEPDTGRKMMFHLGRAMHLAGRCVGCGACEKVCPSGVKIRYLVQELAGFSKELYGTAAGMNPDEASAVNAYDLNDREESFLHQE